MVGPRRRFQAGFSLLEAVVAFAIAAMALVALYQAAGGALHRVGEAEAYTHALMIADALMAQQRSVSADGVNLSGEEDDGFRWRVSSEMLEGVGETVLSPVPLYRVRVTVAWRSGFRERSVELESLRAEGISP